jgi:RNA polymerase sigma factor for flagellar operon FliA
MPLETGRPAAPRTASRPIPHALDDADRELVRQHLPVVGYLVAEMLHRLPPHVERDDLVSAGQLALVNAARAYDATTGVPFGHYARTRIRGALLDELRAADWASRGARMRAKRLAATEDRLAAELGRWPSDLELARELGSDVAAMSTTRGDAHRSIVLSLDQLVDSGANPDEHLPSHHPDPAQLVLQAERLRYLTAAVSALPERLRAVVEGSFLQQRPLAELAEELGVTESRVSQLRTEALALLRDGVLTHLEPGQVQTPVRPEGVAARRRTAYFAQVAAFAVAGVPAARPAARPAAVAAVDSRPLAEITRSA